MKTKKSGQVRRVEIIEAALAILGGGPVESVTTREVAKRIGISQPALFRHFRNRDQILISVIEYSRKALASKIETLIASQLSALGTLEALAVMLLEHATENPALPRLLFHNAAWGRGHPLHLPLASLVSAQRGFAAQLTRDAQEAGDIPDNISSDEAARLFVALLQGEILQQNLGSNEVSSDLRGDRIVAFWHRGIESLEVSSQHESQSASEHTLDQFDVRPIIATGGDPLASIMEMLSRQTSDGLTIITAPFKPSPLLALLPKKGYQTTCKEIDSSVWVVLISGENTPPIFDLRGLEAPGPLEVILNALEELGPHSKLIAWTPRSPTILFNELTERGCTWQTETLHDGSAVIRIEIP